MINFHEMRIKIYKIKISRELFFKYLEYPCVLIAKSDLWHHLIDMLELVVSFRNFPCLFVENPGISILSPANITFPRIRHTCRKMILLHVLYIDCVNVKSKHHICLIKGACSYCGTPLILDKKSVLIHYFSTSTIEVMVGIYFFMVGESYSW